MDCDQPGIVDFTKIDERYGNLDDFKGLVEKAKKLGKPKSLYRYML